MPETHAIRGGDYSAEQGSDGKWTIRDVPIFAEHRRKFDNGAESEWTSEDLGGAIRWASERRAETGYVPRLMVHHHSLFQQPTAIGFFMPTRVVPMALGGKVRQVLLADLFGITDGVFRAIKNLELPYRSVETSPVGAKPKRLTGLSLLPTEAPFFELPLLTIGSEKTHPAPSEAVLAYGASPEVARYLAEFRTMPDAEKDPKDTSNGAAPEKPGEKPEAPAKPADASPEAHPAVLSMLTSIYSGIQQLSKAIESMGRKGAESEGPVVAMAAGGAAAGTETAVPYAADLAAARGEIEGLKGKLGVIEKERAREAALKAAAAELAGYALDADPLVLCAAQYAAGGEPALKAFVAAAKKYAPKDPDADWAAEEAGAAQGGDAPEVAKFAGNPADLAFARQCAKQFDPMFGMSLERFIEAQMRGRPSAPVAA